MDNNAQIMLPRTASRAVGLAHVEATHSVPIAVMVRHLASQQLVKPPFQRDYVWGPIPGKERAWIDFLGSSRQGWGPLIAYFMDHDERTFLCDGLQRLTCTSRFLEIPSRFGFDARQATDLCDTFMIGVEIHKVGSHDDAYERFCQVNSGTGLTPHEKYRYALERSKPYGIRICQEVEQIITISEERGCRTSGARGTPRERRHAKLRDGLGLFYRMVSKDQDFSNYKTSMRKTPETLDFEHTPEGRLAIWQEQRSSSDVTRALEEFRRLCDDVAALAVQSAGTYKKDRITDTLYHHFIAVRIWARNRGMSAKWFIDYCNKWLSNSSSTVFDVVSGETMQPIHISVKMGSLRKLPRVADIFGLKIYPIARAMSRDSPSGFDRSHLIPFSSNGEGRAVLEASIVNRARGAMSIKEYDPLQLMKTMVNDE